MKFISAAILTVIAALAFATPAPAAPLSKGEAERLMTGSRVPFTSSRGNPGLWYFMKDGRFRGEIDSMSGLLSDNGRWWVEPNGLICRQYEYWQAGRKQCVFLVREGGGYRTLEPDGEARDHIWAVEK